MLHVPVLVTQALYENRVFGRIALFQHDHDIESSRQSLLVSKFRFLFVAFTHPYMLCQIQTQTLKSHRSTLTRVRLQLVAVPLLDILVHWVFGYCYYFVKFGNLLFSFNRYRSSYYVTGIDLTRDKSRYLSVVEKESDHR